MSRLCGTLAAGRFLCIKHWRLVPLTIQQTINRQYRAGRKDFAFLSDPTYLQACIDAIKHVASVEGHDIGQGDVSSYSRLLRVALKRQPEGEVRRV